MDLDRSFLTLPQRRSKTGQKVIPLNSAAIEELKGRDRSGIYVFPSTRGEGPTVGLFKSWSRVRSALGLEELRIHDLRHSFASFAAADGASLHMIGKALGHKNTSTTQRYAHRPTILCERCPSASANASNGGMSVIKGRLREPHIEDASPLK